MNAQQWKNWGIESNIYVGEITVHSPQINLDVDYLSKGLDVNFRYQTFGKEKWNQYQNYPDLGVALMYFHLGDNETVGQAIGIVPNVSIDVLRTRRGFIQFRYGWGIGYVSKHYNPVTNPTNNILGSHWNNLVTARFDGGYIFNEHWSGHLGLGVVHYSNGSSQLPNFGINVASANFGFIYTPHPQKDIWHDDFKNIPEKRWGIDSQFSFGMREIGGIGGLRFPVYNASIAATFDFNRVNRMHLGLEFEYHDAIYHFVLNSSTNYDKGKAKSEARRLMIYAADEFLFGDFSLMLQFGFYPKKKILNQQSIYNKFIMRYYFPPTGKPATRFYTMIQLKAHLSVAEYFAIGFGAKI